MLPYLHRNVMDCRVPTSPPCRMLCLRGVKHVGRSSPIHLSLLLDARPQEASGEWSPLAVDKRALINRGDAVATYTLVQAHGLITSAGAERWTIPSVRLVYYAALM